MKFPDNTRIKCQGGKCKEAGCYTCGGYGYLYEYMKACATCEKRAWFRPGNFTCFAGKQFTTMDGLAITYGGEPDWKSYCSDCYDPDPEDNAA